MKDWEKAALYAGGASTAINGGIAMFFGSLLSGVTDLATSVMGPSTISGPGASFIYILYGSAVLQGMGVAAGLNSYTSLGVGWSAAAGTAFAVVPGPYISGMVLGNMYST